MTPLASRISAMDQKINRLRDQKARLSRSPSRSSRTRTLIQAGGLLAKAGWLELFSLTEGDDLQNVQNRPQAASLLGALLSLKSSLDLPGNLPWFQASGLQALHGEKK